MDYYLLMDCAHYVIIHYCSSNFSRQCNKSGSPRGIVHSNTSPCSDSIHILYLSLPPYEPTDCNREFALEDMKGKYNQFRSTSYSTADVFTYPIMDSHSSCNALQHQSQAGFVIQNISQPLNYD